MLNTPAKPSRPTQLLQPSLTRRATLRLLAMAGATAVLPVSRLLGADDTKAVGSGAGASTAPASTGPASEESASTKAASAMQGAGFYAFSVGDIPCTLVSDGGLAFAEPYPLFGANASKEQVQAALAEAFIDYDKVMGQVNTMLVRTGGQTILIDSGAGMFMGPAAGQAVANLAKAGVKPGDIDLIFLTHGHADHIGGLLTPDGKPTFPNARYMIHEKELAFWTGEAPDFSKSDLPEANQKMMTAAAQRTFSRLKSKITTVTDAQEIAPGVKAVLLAGHTPGHCGVMILSGDSGLFYITDTVINAAIMMPHPEWYVAFDTDRDAGVANRRRVLELAAGGRLRVSGAHLPFPSLGHVKRTAGGYEWVPEMWQWTV